VTTVRIDRRVVEVYEDVQRPSAGSSIRSTPRR
jgi:hypothetical protein